MLKVSSFISSTQWDNTSLLAYVPTNIVDSILSISIPDSTLDDAPFWNKTPNGLFSTKSAHDSLLPAHDHIDNPNTHNSKFDWLWNNLKTLPKIIFFLWLCVQNRVNCFLNLFRKHITPSPLCQFCNHEENTLHILRDCKTAKETWGFYNTFLICNLPTFYTDTNVYTWISTNCCLQTNLNDFTSWNTLFSFIC